MSTTQQDNLHFSQILKAVNDVKKRDIDEFQNVITSSLNLISRCNLHSRKQEEQFTSNNNKLRRLKNKSIIRGNIIYDNKSYVLVEEDYQTLLQCGLDYESTNGCDRMNIALGKDMEIAAAEVHNRDIED
ncbi:multisite-specific tRNA:(cytosine-C(5))-methyltransferase [Acrasis kona]|uniref:Multisite-specific tRNA:(Cytosine-C(5))-methyltransferase n=1 Tax=Acrasis kona TaxID=1008807 RepID=A0AAW2YWR5_9EUKA